MCSCVQRHNIVCFFMIISRCATQGRIQNFRRGSFGENMRGREHEPTMGVWGFCPSGRISPLKLKLFTARRNARIASAVLATAIPSVCLSVCLSVKRRYCVKTTARSTVQFAPLDSKMSSFVETKKIFPRDDSFPLKFWLQVTYLLLKAASFDTFCLVAPQP